MRGCYFTHTLRICTALGGLVGVGCQVGANPTDVEAGLVRYDDIVLKRPASHTYVSCTQSNPSLLTEYLRRALNHIAAANRDIFPADRSADLHPDKFCVGLDEDLGPYVVAHADARSRTIEFSPGPVQMIAAQSAALNENVENAILFVLAHEMSHVTLGHLPSEDVLEMQPPAVLANDAFQAKVKGAAAQRALADTAQRELEAAINKTSAWLQTPFRGCALSDRACGQIDFLRTDLFVNEQIRGALAHYDEHNKWPPTVLSLLPEVRAVAGEAAAAELTALLDTMTTHNASARAFEQAHVDQVAAALAFASEIIGDTDAAYNWQEEEADLGAIKLLMRAGIDPFVVGSAAFLGELQDSLDDVACMRKLDGTRAWATAVDRGQETHPPPCWRMWRLRRVQSEFMSGVRASQRAGLARGFDAPALETALNALAPAPKDAPGALGQRNSTGS